MDDHRSLRWMIIDAAGRFLELNPQWGEYFFDLDFLLNRGLSIVERHIAGSAANSAIDLALAWAEEWPAMSSSQRRACLQALTVIAAELLRLVDEAMVTLHPAFQDSVHVQGRREMGVPFAYVQAQNPPGRSDVQHQLPAAVRTAQSNVR